MGREFYGCARAKVCGPCACQPSRGMWSHRRLLAGQIAKSWAAVSVSKCSQGTTALTRAQGSLSQFCRTHPNRKNASLASLCPRPVIYLRYATQLHKIQCWSGGNLWLLRTVQPFCHVERLTSLFPLEPRVEGRDAARGADLGIVRPAERKRSQALADLPISICGFSFRLPLNLQTTHR
jgi:hypothetical protein